MISIYNVKPKFQQLLQPVLVFLYKMGVTANQITLSSIFLSGGIGAAFWFGYTLPIGLLIRMALNALDGMMARVYNQQSKKGEVLNELGDILSDLLVFFPLIRYEKDHLYLVILFICLSIINEFAGLLAKVVSGTRRYDGPMGKSDRALIVGLYGLLCLSSVPFRDYSLEIFGVLNLLLVTSTFIRLYKSLN
jgi:CDP-diacylglycerol--glycerol-3-phosphate 3-phosphatidyltransferase